VPRDLVCCPYGVTQQTHAAALPCCFLLLAAWRSMTRLQRWYAQSLANGSLLRDDQPHSDVTADGQTTQERQLSTGQHLAHTTAGPLSNGNAPKQTPSAAHPVPANGGPPALHDPGSGHPPHHHQCHSFCLGGCKAPGCLLHQHLGKDQAAKRKLAAVLKQQVCQHAYGGCMWACTGGTSSLLVCK
jgi:hypothetical protein